MALLRPITKAQFIVFVNGIEMYFTNFSGINDSAESGSYANGLGNRIFKVSGPRTLDDITLSAPYDPDEAEKVEELWLDYNCEYLTVTVQPVTCGNSFDNIGSPYILEGCLLQSYKAAEVDRESGDVGTIEITLTANSWRRG